MTLLWLQNDVTGACASDQRANSRRLRTAERFWGCPATTTDCVTTARDWAIRQLAE